MNDISIYVGTYKKYNDGNLFGAWLNVENYVDHDDFIEACKELHKDEDDPELMFQDYQGFPAQFYGESYIHPELWDWLELDEEERELLAAWFAEGRNSSDDIADEIKAAQDAFQGKFDSWEDFAEDCVDNGFYGEIPKALEFYIDYEAIGRDLSIDYSMSNEGHVFAP